MKQLNGKISSISLLLMILTLVTAPFTFAQGKESIKELRVLSIGNSFSVCLKTYFPQVVDSVPGCKVHWDHLTIGGCTLERHWTNIDQEEKEPGYKFFKEYTYKEKLQSEKWDVVSIQQASPSSWRPETYMPFLKNIADFVHANAPQAELVIQQTWAYRADDARLVTWKMTPEEMYSKLVAAYYQASREVNARLIPMGLAIQMARQNQPGGYVPLNPSDYKAPNLPDMNRYFLGTVKWNKDNTKMEGDAYHLNKRGEYLQACVWFAFLFNRSATEVTFVPQELQPEDARFLREIAQKAVTEFKQVQDGL